MDYPEEGTINRLTKPGLANRLYQEGKILTDMYTKPIIDKAKTKSFYNPTTGNYE